MKRLIGCVLLFCACGIGSAHAQRFLALVDSCQVPGVATGSISGIVGVDTMLYVAAEDSGLVSFSVAQPRHPALQGITRSLQGIGSMTGIGDNLYAFIHNAIGYGHVQVIDVADPAQPAAGYVIPAPEFSYIWDNRIWTTPRQLVVLGNSPYVFTFFGRSNPEQPELLGTYPGGGT
jgi:hypothetical protein